MPTRLSDKARYEQRLRYYRKHTKQAFNSGKLWNKNDIRLLFESDLSDVQLSRQIGRSVAAIQVKRSLFTD